MAWLTDDMWQTFTTLSGSTVAFPHRTGTIDKPSNSALNARPEWAAWHRTVDARMVTMNQLSEQWQGPDDRGSRVVPANLLIRRPGNPCAAGTHRQAGWRTEVFRQAYDMRERLLITEGHISRLEPELELG